MALDLACDTCPFRRGVDEEWSVDLAARNHESEHPSHFGHITTGE